MSGFSRSGVDPNKCKQHNWIWVGGCTISSPQMQDRKCTLCRKYERLEICKDGVPCSECKDPNCQCCHHEVTVIVQ